MGRLLSLLLHPVCMQQQHRSSFIYSSSHFIFSLKALQHWNNETECCRAVRLAPRTFSQTNTVQTFWCLCTFLITQQGITGPTVIKLHINLNDQANFPLKEEQCSYVILPATSAAHCCWFFTYSLLVRDVQLWFSVRLELVLFKSCIDPSILHDLLQKQSEKFMGFGNWNEIDGILN